LIEKGGKVSKSHCESKKKVVAIKVRTEIFLIPAIKIILRFDLDYTLTEKIGKWNFLSGISVPKNSKELVSLSFAIL
jgi:hypothetical protein